MKLHIKEKLRELGFPEDTMLKPPPRKVVIKGAPKRMKSKPKTRPYIEDIVNVKGDGNCGFRVIARHLGMDEDSHVLVRHALINELKNHKSDYLSIYAIEKRFKVTLDGLHPPTSRSGIALEDKWLNTSDMGHIIATCYNIESLFY
ncbi:hypothetical protein MTR_1g023090 [Medicago truncatula]|uniref:OTU domain-containing protein n=1 Tax=Medicago truncatula TaxID=3880 RepID=G7I5U8_MEDTR|nr:hypothetical protein MTR_1g023090 [Medicago truncatula]